MLFNTKFGVQGPGATVDEVRTFVNGSATNINQDAGDLLEDKKPDNENKDNHSNVDKSH